MQRRFSYAFAAGLLCSGLPGELRGPRLARTALFALFGYALGRQIDELAELSETDPLTRLLNARGFASRLHAELKRAKRYQEPLSLLFLDLDGLKYINDRYGHRAGSEALREVAGVIRTELRESDTGARWGGDEFTILAPETGKDAAVTFAERIRERIERHESERPITASIGIATLDWNDEDSNMAADAHMLMQEADAAMYEAKRRGKNSVAAASQLRLPVELQPELHLPW
jgi:two-component system cell cycle response regulator